MFNIIDYGAVGDSTAKDTAAIQQAIDACTSAGGGTVCVPAGTFLSGTIFLKDNVDLHLMPGAVILGSPDLSDYNKDDCFEQNPVFSSENVTGAHLVIAHEAKNVSISGRGKIDGNSPTFFGPPLEKGFNYSIKDKRPGQMVYFVECENVHVENIEMNNSTYWTCFIHGCENVSVRGVRISNPPRTQNGDGIDVDCCRNVTISDCIIFSGDDCITLRGYNKTLKNKSRYCENVTVSNCVLSTPCNAIRVGVGDGTVRNCTFSNIVITETRNGICLISKYSAAQDTGTTIQNIRFSNLIMETVLPFYVASGLDAISQIENIYFSDIRTTASKTSCIYGNDNVRLKNISFRNVEVEVTAGSKDMVDKEIVPSIHREWDKGSNTAFFCGHCENVKFKDLKISWKNLDAPWQHCFILKDTTTIDIDENGLSKPYPNEDHEIIKTS